jgi:hypothetical protein
MIRGAIAFGLVLRIDKSFPNRDVIVTTCLSLVIVSTVVFGSTIGLISKCIFKNSKEPETIETEFNKEPLLKVKTDDEKDDGYSSVYKSDTKTAYVDVQHPNLAKKQSSHKEPKLRGCAKYLNRFDEMIMKPIFIHKYERNMARQSKDFFELFMK